MIYVHNLTWSKRDINIPYTALHGRDPGLSSLRVFGCIAYVHIDSSIRAKLFAKAWQGFFLGYAFDSHAWLVYNSATDKVIRPRSAIFNEA
jgi:hypothetical protein